MKFWKIFAMPVLLAALICQNALAADIHVTKRDLVLNKTLDKSVTNILVLLQDGETSNTILIASINSSTGRAVMTRIDNALEVDVQEVGKVPFGSVYALGDQKSRGFLAMREINELLDLNVSTYVAVDIEMLPELVGAVGALNLTIDDQEAAALGLPPGNNAMDGESVLRFVRIQLEGDDPSRSRGYEAIFQLLYQGLHSNDLMSLISLGTTLLSSMDTNFNPLNAITLVTAVRGGDDRRELTLSKGDASTLRAMFHREVYE